MPTANLTRCAVLLLGSALPGQTTYVVDASGGPGSHFTQISGALATAVAGDTILVRPGGYFDPDVLVNKGIRLVGDPGAELFPFGLIVSGVPTGQTATVRGFSFGAQGGFAIVSDNLGQVYLEDLRLSPTPIGDNGRLTISNSAQVAVSGVAINGHLSNQVTNSRVVFTNCSFRGLHRGGFVTVPLVLDNSDVSLIGGSAIGATGFFGPPMPGIDVTGGTLTVAGPSTAISTGPAGAFVVPVSAIRNQGGTIELESSVTLNPINGAPPVSAGPVTQRRIPSVVADGLANAGTWHIDLHAPAGSAFCLFVSLPIPALPSPYGEVWFNLGFYGLLGCAAVPPSETVSLQLPVSGLPSGAVFAVQAAVAHTVIELTPPAISIVE